MKTIGAKITILYIFLTVLNIAFFAIMIYDSQMELITENIKFKANEIADKIYLDLNYYTNEVNSNKSKYNKEDVILDELVKFMKRMNKEYVIFNDEGKIYRKSNSSLKITEINIRDAVIAINEKDFSGKQYHTSIVEENYIIHFYFPLSFNNLENTILMFEIRMDEIKDLKKELYLLILFIIIVVSIFHIVFAFILNRVIIVPIKKLKNKSVEISGGNLSARVNLKRKDEIGELGLSFNTMAESVQDKITQLNKQNAIMRKELEMAGRVQKAIYPTIKETDLFKIAIYHKPLTIVSGDYHDIFQINKDKYGILIADVSGHGVPAALVTMRIKEFFRNTAAKYNDTKELFKHVNDDFSDLMLKYDSYFTAFYIIIDKNNIITYSNAGHSKLYLARKDSKELFSLNTEGFMIGIRKSMSDKFKSKKGKIKTGDKIVLFTDGVFESKNVNNEIFGLKRLGALIHKFENYTCDVMLENIVGDYNNFVKDTELKDDVTIMVIEIKN